MDLALNTVWQAERPQREPVYVFQNMFRARCAGRLPQPG